MFDANMRCLPKGLQFFCSVNWCNDTILAKYGVKNGDIIRCKMLDESDHKPRVSMKINGIMWTIKYDEDFHDVFFIYI